MIFDIRAIGKIPAFRAEIRVKSEGRTLSDWAIGPPLLPSLPWHTAQYAL
jgi:hypothetical protein